MNYLFSTFFQPITRRQILDSSKLKEFADDISNMMKMAEDYPTVFSKGSFPRGVKRCHCVGMG